MKNKWLFISILIVGFIFVLAGIGFVVWQGLEQTNVADLGLNFLEGDLFSAESDEEWTFEAEEDTELVIDSDGGDIIIEGANTEEIQITAHKTAWQTTRARAQEELDELSVTVTQTGDKILVNYRKEPAVSFGRQQKNDTVDFTITVPQGAVVNAATDFGEIELSGTLGDSAAVTKFGNLVISGIRGDLEAASSSGDILVENVQAEAGLIDLNSAFGNVSLETARTGSINAHSNSGSVSLSGVDAGEEIQLSSDFGKIDFEQGSADELTIEADSGKVSLSTLEVTAALVVKNGYGDIQLSDVTADEYQLDTNSGKITLDVSGGNVKAVSDFGDVTVRSSAEATLDLYTKSGTVEYAGPLGLGPHSLVTDFGDIEVYLPGETALTFDLETDFGQLKTEFPITLEGDVKQDHWRGTLNGGGAVLKATTNSGDISFETLSR